MAIPQFRSEGVDQGATGSGAFTIDFSSFTWQANDIIEIVFATDGWVPVLTTANGFALAQDPAGNTASQTTNGGVAGANDCGIFVYWKRATGTNTTSDPPPVFQAPSVQSGTSWCIQPNSFSSVRTSGTPYHAITKGIVTTAGSSVSTQPASSTLANCLFMPRVACPTDDAAFNNWTMTGSASPSGTKAADTGWHNGTGNACSFIGDEGGFAAATSNVVATTTFGASVPKQAMVTLVMASLAEVAGITGNDAATLSSSTATSSGGATVTGSDGGTLGASSASSAGGVTVTGSEAAALGSSQAAVSGSTITRTGTEAATLAASLAASSGTVTVGPVGTEAAGLGASSGAAAGAVTVTAAEAAALAGSALTSAGSVSVTGNDAASDTASISAATGTVFTPATLAIGAQAFHERANTLTPNTGTLTTRAVYPAWAPSTTYHCNTNDRVANAGNTYEIAVTSGTSASSGGPTTTPAPVDHGAITDGSAKWNFLAAGTGAVNTQPTGSLILVSLGQGNDAGSGGTAPSDNKGNTYTQVARSTFAGFPQSSAVTWANTAAAGGAGHTFSAPWSLGLDGGGDEKTIAAVEVIGGTRIIDHSLGEFNPVANVCTSNPVTTTGPAVLVCFCWLNAGTASDGTLHTAVPGSGFSILPLASGLMEIGNTAGEVDMCTIARTVTGPGTFTASITTAGGEGAVMHLFAIQGAGVTGSGSAQSSASLAASSGTVTTPRLGNETGALASSSAAHGGAVAVAGSGAAGAAGSRAAGAGVVAVTGAAVNTSGGSIASSAGTLIPVITGNEASADGGSTAVSFGQVISGHAGFVAGLTAGSVAAAAGGVLATGAAAAQSGDSSAASAAQVQISGAAALTAGDSQPSIRGIVGSGIPPRLIGSIGTHGQLTGTLQLQGVIVANIDGPIIVYQGDTAEYLLTVTKDDGSRFNLSTATSIECQVKTVDGAATALVDKTLDSGITLLDQGSPDTEGQAVIALGTGDTGTPGRYRASVVVAAPGLRQHVIPPRDFIIAAV